MIEIECDELSPSECADLAHEFVVNFCLASGTDEGRLLLEELLTIPDMLDMKDDGSRH
jgi:hypothetical protein